MLPLKLPYYMPAFKNVTAMLTIEAMKCFVSSVLAPLEDCFPFDGLKKHEYVQLSSNIYFSSQPLALAVSSEPITIHANLQASHVNM